MRDGSARDHRTLPVLASMASALPPEPCLALEHGQESRPSRMAGGGGGELADLLAQRTLPVCLLMAFTRPLSLRR